MAPGTASPAPDNPPAAAGAGLHDRQGRQVDYLRISVTDRCNYRCTYCMPEDGVDHVPRADILDFEEVTALVACFVRLGVRRLRLTGGEPTVRRDLVTLVAQLKALPGLEDVALSTNGELLESLAQPLRAAGISRLNVSIDTLDAEKFRSITRRGNLSAVLAGLERSREAGFDSIKINTVAVKGFNDGEIGELCRYSFERGFLPRFIEQMPMADGQLFVPGQLLSAAEIRLRAEAAFPGSRVLPDVASRPLGAGPARYFRFEGGAVDGERMGIISPMTEHFCDTCNRVRLSAAGQLHTCLGFDDATDLRAIMRTGGPDAVEAAIVRALQNKRDGHNFQLIGLGGPRKAMVQIGG